MTTLSYPVTGDNLTHAQWSKILRRQHQGVDSGMTLTLSAVSDDATIATGRCSFMGFELDVTVAHVLTLAAVGTATTYVIGVLYDPALEDDAAGPLALTSGVKGSISIPSGGALWPLYEVTRQPSQTLNLAATKSYRAARSSLLVSTAAAADPDPAFAEGSLVLVRPTGVKVLDAEVGTWADVKSDTGFVTAGFSAGTGWSNAGSAYKILNGQVTLHLRATRTGSTVTSSASGSISDLVMLTIPAAVRTAWTLTGRGNVSLASGSSNGFDFKVSSAGAWTLTSANPSLSIAAGSTMFATISYAL